MLDGQKRHISGDSYEALIEDVYARFTNYMADIKDHEIKILLKLNEDKEHLIFNTPALKAMYTQYGHS